MRDISQTILSQYANSPSLCTIINGWNQAIDPSALIDQWYEMIWNVQTAQSYGLDVWGRIVGVSRVLTGSSGTFMGFREASDLTEQGFSQAPFYRPGSGTTENFRLTDSGFRQLITAKALANITNGSVLSINAILRLLFAGQGEAYVRDNGDMSITYVFAFVPSDVQISLIQNSGVLPRPSGISISYSIAS